MAGYKRLGSLIARYYCKIGDMAKECVAFFIITCEAKDGKQAYCMW